MKSALLSYHLSVAGSLLFTNETIKKETMIPYLNDIAASMIAYNFDMPPGTPNYGIGNSQRKRRKRLRGNATY